MRELRRLLGKIMPSTGSQRCSWCRLVQSTGSRIRKLPFLRIIWSHMRIIFRLRKWKIRPIFEGGSAQILKLSAWSFDSDWSKSEDIIQPYNTGSSNISAIHAVTYWRANQRSSTQSVFVFVNYEKKVSEKNEKKKKKRGFVFIFGIDIMVQTLNKCFFFLFVYKI